MMWFQIPGGLIFFVNHLLSTWSYLSSWHMYVCFVVCDKFEEKNMEWRPETEKERTPKEELVQKRGLWCSNLCSSHSKWGTSQKNERGRSPKPRGQANSLQNRGERWSHFGKFAKKVKSMVWRKLRSCKLFSMQRGWEGRQLLEGGGCLCPHMPRMWRRGGDLLWGDGEECLL